MPRPSPRLPPVTTMLRMTLLILPRRFSCGRESKRRHKAYGGRHLVLGEVSSARFHDLVLDRGYSLGVLINLPSEHHVGDDNGAGDGIFSSADQRHPNLGVAVDHGFDFLRMDLQSSDIDDSASPSDEIVPISTQLDDVAGIDEALSIEQLLLIVVQIVLGGSIRTDAQ